MKRFTDLILEFKTDLMPKCVIIIGGPGAGKTYWMTEHNPKDENGVTHHEDSGYKQLFKQPSVAKQLDMDHNLELGQKNNAKQIAQNLAVGLKQGADEKWFQGFIKTKQQHMDALCDRGESPKVDLSIIKFDFIKEWVDKIKNAGKNEYKVKKDFANAFVKEYWRSIFASDFSRRAQSKAEYKETFWQKLQGIVKSDGEIVEDVLNSSDVCIAITGDDITKISEIQNASKGHHAYYIIYLDIPVEMSIEADKKRARHVGEELVRKKIKGVHETWDKLKDKYEDMGIWKMYHFTTELGKHPNWKLSEMLINKNLIGNEKSNTN